MNQSTRKTVLVNALRNTPGGNSRYLKEVIPRLSDLVDLDVKVLTTPDNKTLIEDRHASLRLIVKYRPPWGSFLQPIWEVLCLRKACREISPDILFQPTASVPFWPRSVRTVVTIHDLNFLALPFPWLKVQYNRFLYRYVSKRAVQVISISDSVQKEICDTFAVRSEKISVIPHGVSHLAGSARSSLRLEDGLVRLLAFAHWTHKNPRIVIEVAACLQSMGEKTEVCFVGATESIRSQLCQYASSRGVSLTFAKPIDDENLVALFRSSTALVFPSSYEGFGLPIIEAMRQACPVVASDLGPHREILTGISETYTIADPGGYAAAIQAFLALSPNECMEYTARLVKESEKYDWDKSAEQTRDVLFHAITQNAT